MSASDLVGLLAAAVSAIAAAVGTWVGYLTYRDRRVQETPRHSGSAARPDPSRTLPGDISPVTSAEAPLADQWRVQWTQETLARRATVAVGAGVVSCLCVLTVIVTAFLASDDDGTINDGVVPFLGWVLAIGAASVLVALVTAIHVRRAARGHYRRPWRTATLALWLAFGPWIGGYLLIQVIGALVVD